VLAQARSPKKRRIPRKFAGSQSRSSGLPAARRCRSRGTGRGLTCCATRSSWTGRWTPSDAFLQPHEPRARARGHRSAQARLGYARGRLHGALGDIHAARHSFEASLELLNGLPLRYDIARDNFAFGQTLRRAGKRRQADEVISTAREI